MELPKIKTYVELKGESYQSGFDEADIRPTWRQRLLKLISPDTFADAFALRRSNDRLRQQLLGALMACEDAGRNGLILYAENELLREQVETGLEKRLVRLHELDQLANENRDLRDKLKRAYTDYERLHNDVQKWIKQFGEPKE
jgi:hypothetical protein